MFSMSKSFSFPNVGTCSKQTNIVLNDDHTIESVEVIGGRGLLNDRKSLYRPSIL